MKRLLLVLLIPLVIGLTTFFFFRNKFIAPVDSSQTEEVTIVISPGMSFAEIAADLEKNEVIRSAWGLRVLSRLRSEDTKVSAGEYAFTRAMTPKQILAKLISGETIKRIATIIPGMTVREIIKEIAKSGIVTEEEFKKALNDPAVLKRWAMPGNSFEGYLFPETYHLSKPITAPEIIGILMKEGEKYWTPDFSNRADELKMTRHMILTLASIIEKETGLADERSLVSSVFHNRLKQGMRLQSDPTVIYGIPNFNGNITKIDLETPTPYNTYMITGLPPGPIGSPSLNAIRAALYPATSDYLYFVADGKGGHKFSATYREHRDNVGDFVARQRASK